MASSKNKRLDGMQPRLRAGDKITIAGFECNKAGNLVIDGVNVRTGRKCKTVGLMSFVAQPAEALKSGAR